MRPRNQSASAGSPAASAQWARARSRASPRGSTASTEAAPRARAMATAHRPSPPAPHTPTRAPCPTPPRPDGVQRRCHRIGCDRGDLVRESRRDRQDIALRDGDEVRPAAVPVHRDHRDPTPLPGGAHPGADTNDRPRRLVAENNREERRPQRSLGLDAHRRKRPTRLRSPKKAPVPDRRTSARTGRTLREAFSCRDEQGSGRIDGRVSLCLLGMSHREASGEERCCWSEGAVSGRP